MQALKSVLTSIPPTIRTKVRTIFDFWLDEKDVIPEAEKDKIKGKKIKIITHSGTFHPDDVFACATLMLLLKDNARIIRTRDKDIIKTGDYVVDVGNIYDPKKNRFDHHQEEGAGERKNGIPYASFGLVWKKFGKELCDSKEIAEKIDQKLVQQIDAVDNGIIICKPLKENIYPYDIGELFGSFLPTWKEKADFNKAFFEVFEIAKKILQREILREKHKKVAKKFIVKAYKSAEDKRIIEIPGRIPWRETITQYKEPLFVITQGPDGKWLVLTIRDDPHSFENRKDLPKSWGGLQDKELVKITGVPDAIFCHKNIFIAVAKTHEGALALAKLALRE